MSRSECKEMAKSILKNNWVMAFVTVLIYTAIFGGISSITAGIGGFLIGSILLIALYNVFINAYLGKGYDLKDMLKDYDKGVSNRIALSVLKNIYIFLWTLLFIFPGIIKTYSYYLAEFISRENPEKTAKECLDESKELMNGKKMELFLLHLSFIGWIILSLFTCGILFAWVLPYMYQTLIIFIDKNIYSLKTLDNLNNETETFLEEKTSDKYCHNCGRALDSSENYCPSCGTKVK